MIEPSANIIRRARSLVGAPFRPQGRDPKTGLDCVGVILCTFELPIEEVRRDYRLRGPHLREMETELSKRFRRIAVGESRLADILVCAPSAHQFHLALSCGETFVHADARLRRVVETPGSPTWAIVSAFRPRQSRKRSG